MAIKTFIFSTILILLLLTQTNCVSYSTLQSADTLPPGKMSISGGTSIGINNEFIEDTDNIRLLPEIGTRFGIIKNFDMGIKLIPLMTIFLDGKIQLISSPISASFDLGFSLSAIKGSYFEYYNKTFALYPMLIIGKEHWYFGIKHIYMIRDHKFNFLGDDNFSKYSWLFPSVVVGGVIGNRFRLLPEINLYFTDGIRKIYPIPCVGIDIRF